jgi:hypothetical protein
MEQRDTKIWKDIAGFEGYYQVSNWGRVKSLARYVNCRGGQKLNKERIRKTCNSHGYHNVTMSRDNKQGCFLVHILVADAFIPNPDNLPEINHLDCDKTNNYHKNLERSTKRSNMQHAAANGLLGHQWKGKRYGKHPTSRAIAQFDVSGNLIRVWESTSEAADVLKLNRTNISKSITGAQKTSFGFKWKYA